MGCTPFSGVAEAFALAGLLRLQTANGEEWPALGWYAGRMRWPSTYAAAVAAPLLWSCGGDAAPTADAAHGPDDALASADALAPADARASADANQQPPPVDADPACLERCAFPLELSRRTGRPTARSFQWRSKPSPE